MLTRKRNLFDCTYALESVIRNIRDTSRYYIYRDIFTFTYVINYRIIKVVDINRNFQDTLAYNCLWFKADGSYYDLAVDYMRLVGYLYNVRCKYRRNI